MTTQMITTHGKWILAGEHAVIRGHGALVFPIKEKTLTLRYQPASTAFSLSAEEDQTRHLFERVLQEAHQRLVTQLPPLTGHFHLENSIPLGMGMGASAALCVAVAQWCASQLDEEALHVADFARELEHLFHGRSSGLDIAGVSALTGQYFKQGQCTPVLQRWDPVWYLSHCGTIGLTATCVRQVQSFWERDPTQAAAVDLKMNQCVEQARLALMDETPYAFEQLSLAMNDASTCFETWDLIPTIQQQHMETLRQWGAAAVKPTGAGGGGFVVSLWREPLAASLAAERGFIRG